MPSSPATRSGVPGKQVTDMRSGLGWDHDRERSRFGLMSEDLVTGGHAKVGRHVKVSRARPRAEGLSLSFGGHPGELDP
jgi:hypothetical protein